MTRLLLRLYPRRWRDRYGDEFEELLEQEGSRAGIVTNVVLHALAAHLDLRRHGIRAAVGTAALLGAEWYVYTAGYPNALWLPRSTSSAALLMVVLGALAITLDATTRLIVARAIRRRIST